MSFQDLPSELIYQVYHCLNHKNIAKLSCASRVCNLYSFSAREIKCLYTEENLWFAASQQNLPYILEISNMWDPLSYNVTRVDANHFTALHWASWWSNLECLEFLIKHKVNINYQNRFSETALHFACLRDSIDCVELLIKNGANVNIKDDDGDTPLHNASRNGYIDYLKLLINKNTINNQNNVHCTPLYLTCINNQPECVQILLDHGANINYRHIRNGYTALHIAIFNKYTKCVQILLEHGAKTDILTNDGDTSLHLASKHGHKECVQLLLNHGANVNYQYNARTPLHFASQYGRNECLQLLIDYGADINLQNNCGNTALHIASFYNNIKCVQILLDNGVNITKNYGGQTAISTCRYPTVENMLLEYEAKKGKGIINKIKRYWFMLKK